MLDGDVVRQQVARLADANDKPAWAVGQHGLRLRPVVDEATLARAEQAIGLPLPEEYRDFLTTIGDGGAGPYHGVFALAEALDRARREFGGLDPLASDCPLTTDVDFGELAGEPDNLEEHVARLQDDPEYEAHYSRLSWKYSSRPWTDGRLPIVDYGCGDWFFLVVRGDRRGTVWVDSVQNGSGLYCLDVDFGGFYQRWIDAEIRILEGHAEPHEMHSYLEFGDNPRDQGVREVSVEDAEAALRRAIFG